MFVWSLLSGHWGDSSYKIHVGWLPSCCGLSSEWWWKRLKKSTPSGLITTHRNAEPSERSGNLPGNTLSGFKTNIGEECGTFSLRLLRYIFFFWKNNQMHDIHKNDGSSFCKGHMAHFQTTNSSSAFTFSQTSELVSKWNCRCAYTTGNN